MPEKQSKPAQDARPAIDPELDGLTFEKALAELESIVKQLEDGRVELERSIALYERGARLKAHCEARLRSAEERIEKIVQSGDGSPRAEPAQFD